MLSALTGLLLGAGASYEVGMPLVWDITNELKQWLTPDKLRAFNAGWRDQGGGYPDLVIDDLAAALVRPELHYEAILGHLETQFRRFEKSAKRNDYHGLYSWLVEAVYYILHLRHIQNVPQIERSLRYLDGLANLAASNAPLWVFSLNHDVLVECVAARQGLPLNCGFTSERVTLPRRDGTLTRIGDLHAEVLPGEQIDKSYLPFFQSGQQGINLLKIHGGLDIFTFRNGADLLRILPLDGSVTGVIEALRAANEELFYQASNGRRAKATNEIAYADDAGEMQFLRRSLLAGAFKFDNRESQVLPKKMLQHFQSNLAYVTTLVCIGYGFGDIHINQVIRDWLQTVSDRRIEIVSPGTKAIPGFLLHLAPQVTAWDTTATDFLDQRAAIVRDPLYAVERRFAAWMRKRDRAYVQVELQKFMQKQHDNLVKAFVEKVTQLPRREGGIDLAALGTTAPELGQRMAAELTGPFEELLGSFMREMEHRETSERAYYRWVNGGREHARDMEDWYVAEGTLRGS
jgi:hypothetical protein